MTEHDGKILGITTAAAAECIAAAENAIAAGNIIAALDNIVSGLSMTRQALDYCDDGIYSARFALLVMLKRIDNAAKKAG